jgi:periplasmic divalent cation tolerance protein
VEPPDRRPATPLGPGADGVPPDDAVVEVHVTTPDAGSAEHLAQVLLDERLAACVQVVPGVRSFYRWEGEVATDDEHLLLVKSTAGLVTTLRDRILSEHPYDVPEVLAVPTSAVDARYAAWLRQSVRSPDPGAAAAGDGS